MKKTFAFSLDKDLHARFQTYCKKEGKMMSPLVARLMTNFLKYGENA